MMQLNMRISLAFVAATSALAPGKVAPPTKTALARRAASTAAALILAAPIAAPTVSYAAVCDFAPTSDLCVQERQREALKPKAKGATGTKPAFAVAKPVAKPAPPPIKLTKEAQAVADAEAAIAKMEAKKRDMTTQFEAQKKKVDAMPEVQEMMKMKGQMEAAVKEYDSAAPRMKAQLPKMKEVRDKKAKKAKFVAALCGNQPPRHRTDAVTATSSRRWPENSTPSSRRSYGDNIASMAWGARNLISTHRSPPTRRGAKRRSATRRPRSRPPRTKKPRTRSCEKRRRRSRRRPTGKRKRSAARAGRRSRVCSNYTLLTKLIRVARRPPRRAPRRERRHDGAL